MIPPRRLCDEKLNNIPGEAEIGIRAVATALPYVKPLKNRKEREPQMTAQAVERGKQESC